MENHLGRYLENNEEVHHIDENSLNDSIDNLEIRNATEHRQYHQLKDGISIEFFLCPNCNKSFELSGKRLNNSVQSKRRRNSLGPFCSRSCAGKFCNGYRK